MLIQEKPRMRYSVINWWKPTTTVREILTTLFAVFYWQSPESPYGLERNMEYNTNRELFEFKAKYFNVKYASPNNYNKNYDKDWDFSFNENVPNPPEKKQKEEKTFNKNNDKNELITLYFSLNGISEKKLECKPVELIENIIKRLLDENNFKQNEEYLFIFNSQRLKLEVPIGENGLENNSKITIIYDVLFA